MYRFIIPDIYEKFTVSGSLGNHHSQVSLIDELFSRADVVSIHVPYTDDTHHLVDERLLGIMKPDAVLINTSRGPLVDEAAMARALSEGRLAGAGLDVFEEEPPVVDNPLFSHPNVVATPHSAALSRECVAKVAVTAAEAVVAVARGGTPCFVYNRKELGL